MMGIARISEENKNDRAKKKITKKLLFLIQAGCGKENTIKIKESVGLIYSQAFRIYFKRLIKPKYSIPIKTY